MIRVDPNPILLVSLYKGIIWTKRETDAEGRCVKTQEEDRHLQVKEYLRPPKAGREA